MGFSEFLKMNKRVIVRDTDKGQLSKKWKVISVLFDLTGSRIDDVLIISNDASFEEITANVNIIHPHNLHKLAEVRKGKSGRITSVKLKDEALKYQAVFIDNIHEFRHGGTIKGKILEKICEGMGCVVGLTPTPVVNDNTDLINQLRIIGRLEDFGGYKTFVNRYCQGAVKSSNNDELLDKLREYCYYEM